MLMSTGPQAFVCDEGKGEVRRQDPEESSKVSHGTPWPPLSSTHAHEPRSPFRLTKGWGNTYVDMQVM